MTCTPRDLRFSVFTAGGDLVSSIFRFRPAKGDMGKDEGDAAKGTTGAFPLSLSVSALAAPRPEPRESGVNPSSVDLWLTCLANSLTAKSWRFAAAASRSAALIISAILFCSPSTSAERSVSFCSLLATTSSRVERTASYCAAACAAARDAVSTATKDCCCKRTACACSAASSSAPRSVFAVSSASDCRSNATYARAISSSRASTSRSRATKAASRVSSTLLCCSRALECSCCGSTTGAQVATRETPAALSERGPLRRSRCEALAFSFSVSVSSEDSFFSVSFTTRLRVAISPLACSISCRALARSFCTVSRVFECTGDFARAAAADCSALVARCSSSATFSSAARASLRAFESVSNVECRVSRSPISSFLCVSTSISLRVTTRLNSARSCSTLACTPRSLPTARLISATSPRASPSAVCAAARSRSVS
mmetsp:Transcript_14049/g.46567  ORF Transcript_14049/g.46567 Transcript_14049/m.46567 type:complete len:429 (-) Transcript_14049:355-1641(-)